MFARDPGPAHVIPVQRIRPGDHAFVSYDCDDTRWDVPSTFTRLGLANGEKVIVFAAPGVPEDEVLARLDLSEPLVRTTRDRGQLVLSSMRALIHPDLRFTPERQMDRLREATDRAIEEGFSGLRTYIDMRWVPDLQAELAVMQHRETHAHHLFTNRPYTEICAYDRRLFSEDVLDSMAEAHPCNLLTRLGVLRTVHTDSSLVLTGEADLATREVFREALDRGRASAVEHDSDLLVDLTHLHFLDVASADDLLRLGRSTSQGPPVRIRCSAFQADMLRRLGAHRAPRLSLIEVGP